MTFRISLPVATATLILIPAAMVAWDLFLRPQPASLPSFSTTAVERPRSATAGPSMASGHSTIASRDDRPAPGQAPAPSSRHSLSVRRNPSHGNTGTFSPAAGFSGHQEAQEPVSSRTSSFHRDSSGGPSSPAVLSSAAAAPVPANPADKGNHFTAHGQRIEVTASEPSADGPILHIQLTETSRTSSAHPSDQRLGFTLEEELFRTKWGWEAFDRVQRAALQEASLVR